MLKWVKISERADPPPHSQPDRKIAIFCYDFPNQKISWPLKDCSAVPNKVALGLVIVLPLKAFTMHEFEK